MSLAVLVLAMLDDQRVARERELMVDVLVEFESQWAERGRLSYTDLYRALNRLVRSDVIHVDSRWRLGPREVAS